MSARHWVTAPAVGMAALVLAGTAPLWAPIAAGFDAALGRRWATLRALAFATAYAWAEVYGLACAVWIGADPAANYALQRRWAGALWRAAVWLYALDVRIEGEEHATPGPVLVLPRHTSLADTMLPIVVLGAMRPRYVLKRELQWDPCLDVVGNRVPNAFVQRSGDTAHALAQVGALADGLGAGDAIVLYPEGTRFSPERQRRALQRLTEPRRTRCAAWQHVLPPHAGGVLAVLARRRIDVVFCAHRGFEPAANARALLDGAMTGRRVSVALWRVPAAQIPMDRAEQAEWLDAAWAEMERRVAAMAEGPTPAPSR